MLRFLLPLLTFSLLLVACQQNVGETQTETASTEVNTTSSANTDQQTAIAQFVKQTVTPPIPEAAPSYEDFVVTPSQGKTISLPSGTQIKVPANAFVYDDGRVVKEKVTIHFREFHSVADIILSGIPMRDWSTDEKWENMLTAGMFDIRGFSESGETVQIADDQSITVDLASGVDGTFDFWFFDEEAGDWLDSGNNTAQPMPAARVQPANGRTADAPVRPTKPVRFSKDQPALDFDVDYSEFPALADKKGVIFQYKGKLGSQSDPVKNDWIFDEEWFVAKLEATEQVNVYQLFLENDDKEFTTTVQAVLSEADYQTALSDYTAALAAYQAYQEAAAFRRETAAKFTRQMSINQFGIYNYDVYKNWEEPVLAQANFSAPSETNGVLIEQVYLITTQGQMVVSYPRRDWNAFNYDANRRNMLVALGDNLEVYTLDAATFAQQAKPQEGEKQMSFQLESAGFHATDVAQLDLLLNGGAMAAL